jgi:hypothetical protein
MLLKEPKLQLKLNKIYENPEWALSKQTSTPTDIIKLLNDSLLQ